MNRRTYLALGVAGVCGCTTPSSNSISCAVSYKSSDGMQGTTAEISLSDTDRTHATVLAGSGGPNVSFERYYSHIYWVGQNAFASLPETWLGAATVGPKSGQKGEIYLNKNAPFISDYVIYHERGHNLGFTHSDMGIMSYHSPDQISTHIADVTETVVKHSDGVVYIEWDADTRQRFRKLYRQGELSDTAAMYVFGRENGEADVWSTGEIAAAVDRDGRDVSGGGFYTDTNDGWR